MIICLIITQQNELIFREHLAKTNKVILEETVYSFHIIDEISPIIVIIRSTIGLPIVNFL